MRLQGNFHRVCSGGFMAGEEGRGGGSKVASDREVSRVTTSSQVFRYYTR